MDPQDDPEARIRALEQPLNDVAKASELGIGQQYGATYGFPPPPTQPGSYPGYPGVQRRSGFRPWMLIVPITLVVLTAAVGGAAWMVYQNTSVSGISGSPAPPSQRRSVTMIPSALPPVAPPESLPEPGSTISVSGIGSNKTIACNESVMVVSGANNTITITGHCSSLTVSGFENIITVDSAGAITAAGFNNHVTFHSGAPEVNQSGDGNIIEHG